MLTVALRAGVTVLRCSVAIMKPAAASGRHPPLYIWMSEKHQATGSEDVAASWLEKTLRRLS
jgi:hypothetical protein